MIRRAVAKHWRFLFPLSLLLTGLALPGRTAGRASIRLIEAADALLGYRGALPPEMSAEILAASEKIEGPVQEVGKN